MLKKKKKKKLVFAYTFFMILLTFSFFYGLGTVYVNTHNIASKNKIELLDVQRTGVDKAVFSVFGEKFEYPIYEKKKMPGFVYALVPNNFKLSAGIMGFCDKLLFPQDNSPQPVKIKKENSESRNISETTPDETTLPQETTQEETTVSEETKVVIEVPDKESQTTTAPETTTTPKNSDNTEN